MQHTQPTVYQSIIAPFLTLLQHEVDELKQDHYTLSLYFFTINLCYAIITGIRSIRLLVTETKTSQDAQQAGIIAVSQSLYSEAFYRYDPAIFRRLFLGLVDQLKLKSLPEIDALGRFILMDGSIFPAIKTMDWATYKKTTNGIKLHLCFELNRMIPVQFISTDANGSEKKALKAILEEGVTYIADRGYIAFDLFTQITCQSAFFIIRVKSNMDVTTRENLAVNLPASWQTHLSQLEDRRIVFTGDKQGKEYRLISFEALGQSYRIVSNRFDLQTYEIIMLYAYRWQIELFFRCIKRCFNGLHLWAHNEKGIEIQFYLYMITYLLLLHFKQRNHEEITLSDGHNGAQQATENKRKQGVTFATRTPECGIVTLLANKLKGTWKIGIHWLKAVKNMLAQPWNIETMRRLNSF
jgi:hypothetical protein